MDRRTALPTAVVAVLAVTLVLPVALHAQETPESDRHAFQVMDECNGVLKALWMDIRVEAFEFLSIDGKKEKKSVRGHSQPARWAPFDSRRNDDGNRLTWLVDDQDTSGSGLESRAVDDAIERAMLSWSGQGCFKADVEKRNGGGADADIFDALLEFGGFGDFRLADVVHAGWMPPVFFDAMAGEGGGETIAAVSVTFVFVDLDGVPTDVDQDGFLDIALSEIYYNSGFPWLLEEGHGLDVESVALHELGHSLGLGHVEEPVPSVMAPFYKGTYRDLEPADKKTLCSIWSDWPKNEV